MMTQTLEGHIYRAVKLAMMRPNDSVLIHALVPHVVRDTPALYLGVGTAWPTLCSDKGCRCWRGDAVFLGLN